MGNQIQIKSDLQFLGQIKSNFKSKFVKSTLNPDERCCTKPRAINALEILPHECLKWKHIKYHSLQMETEEGSLPLLRPEMRIYKRSYAVALPPLSLPYLHRLPY